MAFTFGVSMPSGARRLMLAFVAAMAVLAALVALGTNHATSNADWQVLAVSGDVSWRASGATVGGWQKLEPNSRVPDGAEIRTGGNGSAVVAKSLDRIELRANTSVTVAARVSSNTTEMYQSSGSATYTVEKRPAGTFSVRTPYVLAVVKGTKFDVDVTKADTSVSVEQGRVGVSDSRSGDSVDIDPGERARARASQTGLDVGRSSAAPAAPGKKAASGSTPSAPAAGSAKGSPAGAAGKGLDTAVDAVGETASEASDVVGGAVDSAGGVVGGAVDAAGGVVGGVTGAVGDLGSAVGGGGSGGGGGDSGGGGGDSGGGGGDSGGGGGDSGGGGSDGDSGGSSGGDSGGSSGGGGGDSGGGGGLGGAVGDAVGGLL